VAGLGRHITNAFPSGDPLAFLIGLRVVCHHLLAELAHLFGSRPFGREPAQHKSASPPAAVAKVWSAGVASPGTPRSDNGGGLLHVGLPLWNVGLPLRSLLIWIFLRHRLAQPLRVVLQRNIFVEFLMNAVDREVVDVFGLLDQLGAAFLVTLGKGLERLFGDLPRTII
jgi:hypothetical protein